ncbi:hypothetical protein DFP72DRAFT_913730 [Ephemerocybe angulata]|uniref:Uncharacterized protein n=1 Tax=Ephemerocybe angulata TaxID=980116 RepID=A0A8H6M1X5_9AGAR|nr:hypothetical protein DFP72DRAFT_913730 [Tulosesus angulatus]
MSASRTVTFTKLLCVGPKGYALYEAYVSVTCDESCRFRVLPAEREEVDTSQAITQTNQKKTSEQNATMAQLQVTASTGKATVGNTHTVGTEDTATDTTNRTAIQVKHDDGDKSSTVIYTKNLVIGEPTRLSLGEGDLPIFTVNPQSCERLPKEYTVKVHSIWTLNPCVLR